MRKVHSFHGSNRHHNTSTAPRRPVNTGRCIASGLVLAAAILGQTPARADNPGGCLTGEWITEATAFVTEETGAPIPEVCVRSGKPEQLKVLVLPAALGNADNETVAAVYVPATREILLADDLDPGTPLARSYLVHELVHAQQFARRAHEQASCPGALEADAYGTQAHYLRTRGLPEEAFLLQILGMFQGACGYSN